MNRDRLNRQQRRAARAQGQWVPLQRARAVPPTPGQVEDLVRHAQAASPQMSEATIREHIAEAASEESEIWKNDQYQVHVIPWPPMRINDHAYPVIQLSVRRLDRAPARDWRDFQRIKNQLLGPEIEGIEIYPAESRLVDTATQYHVWCVNDPLFRFPFGYDAGRVVSDKAGGGAVQRPLVEAG